MLQARPHLRGLQPQVLAAAAGAERLDLDDPLARLDVAGRGRLVAGVARLASGVPLELHHPRYTGRAQVKGRP